MVSPATKRRAVQMSTEEGLGTTAQACRALGLSRSTFYHPKKVTEEKQEVHDQVVKISRKQPRYGYRRVTALLRRDGKCVNHKRVQRIRSEEGLQVKKQQRKMRRLGVSTAQRRRANKPNEVWSWDFVQDSTSNGSHFRILTLIDEYTRQCLATHVDWSIRANDVIDVVSKAIASHGTPEHIRSDNGPEFIAYAIRDWLKDKGIETMYIRPGSPWEQAHIESFHDKFRDESLNREWFGSLLEARVIIEQWRKEYNHERPHSSLGYLTPKEFASLAMPDSGRATPALHQALQNRIQPNKLFNNTKMITAKL